MKKHNPKRFRVVRGFVLTLMLLMVFMAGTSVAADVYLKAATFVKTMPDGTAITMWGYSSCDATFTTCAAATVPGPTITTAEGDTLHIHVQNGLTGLKTEPTSVVIHGQTPVLAAGTYPVWTDGTTGPRTNTSQRVRSFTTEAAIGATVVYTWTGLKPGTYLYQSGTHPAVQVQMGLYGALIVNSATANQAYDNASTAYDAQVTLLMSEIDPELHYSIESGRYGTPPPAPPAKPLRGQRTSAEDYHPKYFLINGTPYSPGIAPILAGNPGQRLLLRFLNAGLIEKTPTLQNHMTVVAEDGNLYPYSKSQYSILLPAGKTMDAVLTTPAQAGYIPIHDRSLNLSNAAATPGGDLIYLQAGPSPVTLTVLKNGTGTGRVSALSIPGGIDCGAVCTQSYVANTEIRLVGTPSPGSLLTAWTGGGCSGFGDCIVTMNADTTVTATFTKFTNVTVISPIKGAVVSAGSTINIRWGAPATAVTFRIQYSLNGGFAWTTIATGVTGSIYPWTTPVPTATNTNVVVRVQAYNAKGALIGTGSSGKFTISVP